MASIMPFTGFRYNTSVAGDLLDLVTPPYDVIDAAAQERYYNRHPNNIIRLEYGKAEPADDSANNTYTRAAKDLTTWIETGVLTQEAEPALYFYEQEFTIDCLAKIRSGFFCTVKLESYDRGVVLPHEETIPKHKADRLELLRASSANLSPVFSLYADTERQVERVLRQHIGNRAPEVSFTDESGESHRIWVVTDREVIGEVQLIMADKQIFIADGHHRYETALNYKNERIAQGAPADDPCNYIMMALVNLYDPGLVVLPTHRLIRDLADFSIDRLLDRLRQYFTIEEYPINHQETAFLELLDLLTRRGRMLHGAGHHHVFGLYVPGDRFFLLQLDADKGLTPALLPGKSQAWCDLDVAVLQTLVLDRCLGINSELVAKGEHIAYAKSGEEAKASVDNGEFQAAFFLNPTLVEEILLVAGRGEKMPQKSTFFYPKLSAGLVLNRLC